MNSASQAAAAIRAGLSNADYLERLGLREGERAVHEYEFGVDGASPRKIGSSVISAPRASDEQPLAQPSPCDRSPCR
jgi:hypothetical protein